MITTLSVATALLVLMTLLPLSRNQHWLIRGLDFPRLQLTLFASVLLASQLVFLDFSSAPAQILMSATLICLVWQAWWILPYTRLWRVEVKRANGMSADRQVSILTANVLTPNRAAQKLLDLVAQHEPDVLVTLESDLWWQRQLDSLEPDMPYTMKCPLDNLYGMHVYSRLPLEDKSIEYLVEDDVPSMHARLRLRTGDPVSVHFLHPAPPSPTENPESAERDAELIVVARSIAEREAPVVVTGDLNDVAWSATTRLFRKQSGLLDPRVGRGMFNTFHADYPFLRWPLDHLFHSEHFTLHSILRLPSIGSDHFALLTRLVYSPARGARQDGLEADATDEFRARDILNGHDVDRSDVPRPSSNRTRRSRRERQA